MSVQPLGHLADLVLRQDPSTLFDLNRSTMRSAAKPVKILIIDQAYHNSRLKALLADQTPSNFRLRTAGQLTTGLTYLQREHFDLVMLGLNLPDYRGLEALSRLQLQEFNLPIIIVADSDEETLAMRVVEYGAYDYLIRGELTPRLLKHTIRQALERYTLHDKLRQIQTQCEKLQHDMTAVIREKQILLKEVHHRVKNNLQLISSLLSLQTQYVEDQTFLEMLKNGQNRIKSLAIVQEQFYQFDDLARVDFNVYVQKLLAHLLGCYLIDESEIDLTIQVDVPPLGVDLAIPCGLILNELLTNIFQHAFPEGGSTADGQKCRGSIQLCRSPESHEIILTVRDNGIGLASYADVQGYERLGLKLVQLLTHQLDGVLRVQSKPQTEFTITFPETS